MTQVVRKMRVLRLQVCELRSGGKLAMTEDQARMSSDVKSVRQTLYMAVSREGDTTYVSYSEPTQYGSVLSGVQDFVLSTGPVCDVVSTENGFKFV